MLGQVGLQGRRILLTKSSLETDFSGQGPVVAEWSSHQYHMYRYLFSFFYLMAADVWSAPLSQVAPVTEVTAFQRASANNTACVHFTVSLSTSSTHSHHPFLPLFFLHLLPLSVSHTDIYLENYAAGEKDRVMETAKKITFPFCNLRRARVSFCPPSRRVRGCAAGESDGVTQCDPQERPQLCLC